MVLVLLFIVLFFSFMAVAYHQTSAALRLETVQAARVQRDEGSLQAAARALYLLETGFPPRSPYVGGVVIATSSGTRSYTVTFVQVGKNQWSVNSGPTPPGQNLPPLPSSFAPPRWKSAG
jgi:hypothetical protein